MTEVFSSVLIRSDPGRVWSLLCDARMPLAAPCCFRIGVPTPERCRLVGDATGVGAHRQCQTRQGTIDQRITEWEAPSRLSFEMVTDSMGLGKHLRSMADTFTLEPAEGGTRLTRLTRFETKGPFAGAKALLFRLSVRHIHRYVMKGFKVLGEDGAMPSGSGSLEGFLKSFGFSLLLALV